MTSDIFSPRSRGLEKFKLRKQIVPASSFLANIQQQHSNLLFMAPKPAAKGKGPPKGKGSAKGSKLGKGAATSTARKPMPTGPRPKTVQVKTKPGSQTANKAPKKKKRIYTDKELNLPALNMITPAGVTKPKGKKKGKIFIDDKESMMTILALVNAEKEGQIESKMIRQGS